MACRERCQLSLEYQTSAELGWLLDGAKAPSTKQLHSLAEFICEASDVDAILPVLHHIESLSDSFVVMTAYRTFEDRVAQLVPFLSHETEGHTLKLLEFSQAVTGALLKRLRKCTGELENFPAETSPAHVGHLSAIQQISNFANSTLGLEQILDRTTQAVAEVLMLDDCSIYLFDEGSNSLVLRATTGLNSRAIGRTNFNISHGIIGWSVRHGKPVAVENAREDPRYIYSPEIRDDHLRSMLSVPIILYTVGKLIGVICFQTCTTRKFSREEIGFAETVCGQVAIAIENARLYEQTDETLRARISQLTTLQRVRASIASSLDLDQVLEVIARHAAELSSADKAAILKLDEKEQELYIVARYNLTDEYKALRIRVAEGAMAQSISERTAVSVEDVFNDPVVAQLQPQLQAEGIRSLFWVPLSSREKLLGGICVLSVERREFSEEQIQLTTMFAYDAALAIENARLYQEAQKALETQAVLMREMQHRVKNNLQTVASLLSLQMRRAESLEAAGLLGLSAARVESIAAVHELFSEKGIGAATVGDIANRIVDIVLQDLVPPSQTIEFAIEPAPIELGSKQATFFALVLNELVSNAVMHGLAGYPVGKIRVTASQNDGDIAVYVWNSGRGMPQEFALQTHAGLGLSIVEQLVTNELSGVFTIENESPGGATARITFPAMRDDFWTVWWKD